MRPTAFVLARGRVMNQANLPESCDVEMPVAVDDGEGGATVTWEVEETLPCRVSPLGSPDERISVGRPVEDREYTVAFAALTELPLGCRLRVTLGAEELLLDPKGSEGPRTYEVMRRYDCRIWRGREEGGSS